jgi:hypothetical protein
MRVPRSFVIHVEHGLTPACKISLVCPGTGAWRGWVVGSAQSATQHLVVTASPRRLADYARLVYGAAGYPTAHVKPLAWVKVGTRRMRAVLVPSGSESAFGNHVVLIWTVGQHTYGVGFHNVEQFACPSCRPTVHGLRQTLVLDEELARHIKLVRP